MFGFRGMPINDNRNILGLSSSNETYNGILYILHLFPPNENEKGKYFILLNKNGNGINLFTCKNDNKMGTSNAYFKSFGMVTVFEEDIKNMKKDRVIKLKRMTGFPNPNEIPKEIDAEIKYSVLGNKIIPYINGESHRISIVIDDSNVWKNGGNYLVISEEIKKKLKNYEKINNKLNLSDDNKLILMKLDEFIKLSELMRNYGDNKKVFQNKIECSDCKYYELLNGNIQISNLGNYETDLKMISLDNEYFNILKNFK